MPKSADLLLSGGTVVTMNANYDIYVDGAAAIGDNLILAVGPREEILREYDAAEIVECHGQIIIPGLVNAHTHIPMTLFRGLHDDLRLDVWLGYLMPLEREFVNPEFVRLGARLACAEMIRSGITSFADMYYYEEAIAEETDQIGMRALLGQTILIFPAPDATTFEEGLTRCRRFVERWNDHPLIQPAVAPHAWYTATPELLRACADLAIALDVPLHTHVSESRLEVNNCRNDNHMGVVPWLEQHGLLNTKLLAAHCVHLDRAEMFQLKEAGAGVAHCPSSNLKLASGIAPVGEMLGIGLHIGVGTDGPASNNDLDMFEETRLAALLAKTESSDPTVLPARQALEIATIGGARAMHMADVTGSLEPGKRADIVVVRVDSVHNQPHFHNNPDNVYSRLIYAAKSNDVLHVLCDGRWLMRERDLLTINEEDTKKKAADVAARIDAFVVERESSPYNKLVFLAGVQRQESFEVQIKVPIQDDKTIIEKMESGQLEITKYSHYRQFDTYFYFDVADPDAARLRYREDEFINPQGEVTQVRARLTLIGEEERRSFGNAVMLSRSRFLASADRSLRFYQEYFDPHAEISLNKDRLRWRIVYKGTDFAINLDRVIKPEIPGYFLEVKSRTWSVSDAERKAGLIIEILDLFGVDLDSAEERDYVHIVSETV
ncbi:MAG: amidohydrolase [Candidatus Promineifilaceae bacterium]|nr:amidohydrolase [Candidatus Promineifilaceae bacterium]